MFVQAQAATKRLGSKGLHGRVQAARMSEIKEWYKLSKARLALVYYSLPRANCQSAVIDLRSVNQSK